MQNNQNQPTKKSRGGWFVLLLVLLALAIAATGIGLFHGDLQDILDTAGTETDAGTGGDSTTVPSLPGGNGNGGTTQGSTTTAPSTEFNNLESGSVGVVKNDDRYILYLNCWSYLSTIEHLYEPKSTACFRVRADRIVETGDLHFDPGALMSVSSDLKSWKAWGEIEDLYTATEFGLHYYSSYLVSNNIKQDSYIMLGVYDAEYVDSNYESATAFATSVLADANQKVTSGYLTTYFPLYYTHVNAVG